MTEIWLAKLLREALSFPLKTPMRSALLELVECDPPAGCVIALCPTPWARLLAEWWRVRQPGVVLAVGRWRQRTDNLAIAGGFVALRGLVQHLRQGGRAVIVAVSSPRSHPARMRFLGEERPVSLLPARLALAAGVPLLLAVAHFRDGFVQVRFVSPDTGHCRGDELAVMKLLLARLEEEIRRCPAIWRGILKHPRAS